MDRFNRMIAAELERLRNETDSDFAALAVPVPDKASWRWAYASGNLSGRYALLAVKPGRGIAGAALRTERAVVLGGHRHTSDIRREDAPLLTSERLEAAAAAPVLQPQGAAGVLLVGARSVRDYNTASLEKLYESARRISSLMIGSLR